MSNIRFIRSLLIAQFFVLVPFAVLADAPKANADEKPGKIVSEAEVNRAASRKQFPISKLLPGMEECGDDRGRLAVDVDRFAECRFERARVRADLGREILGVAGEVEAEAEDQFTD